MSEVTEMVSLLASLVFLGASTPTILPPYVRVKTLHLDGHVSADLPLLLGGLLFTPTPTGIEAYDLVRQKARWKVKLPYDHAPDQMCLVGNRLIVGVGYQLNAPNLLASFDATTGKRQWLQKGVGSIDALAGVSDTLYVATHADSVKALSLTTQKLKWKYSLPQIKEQDFGEKAVLQATPRGCVISQRKWTYAFSDKGKLLWSQKGGYLPQGQPVDPSGVVFIAQDTGSLGRDFASGRVRWKSGLSYCRSVFLAGNRFLAYDSRVVASINPRTGKTLWSRQVGAKDSYSSVDFATLVGDTIFALGKDQEVILNLSGKVVRTLPTNRWIGRPFYRTENRLYVIEPDGSLVQVYRRGSLPALPSGTKARHALALQMLKHYGDLDAAETERFRTLAQGDFTFLLKLVTALPPKETAYDSLTREVIGMVDEAATKDKTDDLLNAVKACPKDSGARTLLLNVLVRHGDPAKIAPIMVGILRGTKTPGFEMYESDTYIARSFVADSPEPVCRRFMLDCLKDPKADPVLREAAYDNLAETGGDEGLAAVLAERHKRKLLPPLADRVVDGFLGAGEFGTHGKLLAEKKDKDGRVWGLLQSGILGSFGDLWLAEKVNGKWVHALFSGVSTEGNSRWVKDPPPEPTIGGKTGKELAEGAWFDVLVNNAEIRKDSTGCGVTDLEKKRLGLDVMRADTDGDGDGDDVDPWPNAPQRPLTEAEQVLAAAFEARYHFDNSMGPALFYAPWKMEPFEMPGRSGPTIWVPYSKDRKPWTLPLELCYEQGIALINISGGNGKAEPTPDNVISWNGAHTEASLTISTYYGGLNGTGYSVRVRKFGKEWVVVEMRMAYVS